MKKIYLTSFKYPGLFAKVDDEDYERLVKYSWHPVHSNDRLRIYAAAYVPRTVSGAQKDRQILMHRAVLNLKTKPYGVDGRKNNGRRKNDIDHKNTDGLDNRKKNLRICTASQNQHNKRVSRNNKLGVKGICYSEKYKKYQAQICVNSKVLYIGRYNNLEEAKKAYAAASKKYHKSFGRT